jgi:uncharacterized protein (TIGR02246 family)
MRPMLVSSLSVAVLLVAWPVSASDLHQEAVALEQSFAKAFTHADAKAVADLYTNDAILIGAVEGDEHTGKRNIERAFAELFKNLKSTVEHSSTEVRRLDGKHAAVISHWIQTLMLPDGKKQEVRVRSTAVLEKHRGQWKYLVDHVSVGLPPPPPPQAKPQPSAKSPGQR